MSEANAGPIERVSFDELRMYGEALIEIMRRKGVNLTKVADAAGVDRAHLTKVKNGQRTMTLQTIQALMTHLEVDRNRLALAICVMRQPQYYFDPRFRNAAYFVQYVLEATMDTPTDNMSSMVFSSLTKETAETYAAQVLDSMADKFSENGRRKRPGTA
jgi:transcriptional regulator with XRE-family HTH domain